MRGVGLVVVASPIRVRGGSGTAQLHPFIGDLLRAHCKGPQFRFGDHIDTNLPSNIKTGLTCIRRCRRRTGSRLRQRNPNAGVPWFGQVEADRGCIPLSAP